MAGGVEIHNEFDLRSDWYEMEEFGDILLHTGIKGGGFALVIVGKCWRAKDNRLGYGALPLIARTFDVDLEFALRVIQLGIKKGLFEPCKTEASDPQATLELPFSKSQANTSQSSQVKQVNQVDQDNQSGTYFHCPFVSKKYAEYMARLEGCRQSGKRGGQIAAGQRPPAEFPDPFNTPECRAAWNEWLEHKKLKGKSYKSQKSQSAMLTELKNRQWTAEMFCQGIQASMAANYDGIFEAPKANGAGKKSNFQKNLEERERLLRQEGASA